MVVESNEESPGAGNGTATSAQIRRAGLASAIGTSIEWYDYFLYGTAAALVFPDVFFPGVDHYVAVLESFATYAVGFAARPIGAAIFGHWGDRIGRKTMLITTLLIMGLSTTLIGVLPGVASIGAAAPILLILLRVLQGIAVGGEWSGSVLLAMEWGHQRKRGLMASLPQLGVPIGLILGTALLSVFNTAAGDDAFLTWGWRVPFLLSLVMVAIGLFIRLKILETPMFARLVSQKKVHKAPIMQVIRKHPKEIVLSALLRMSEQMPFYVFTAFVLSYVVDQGVSKGFALNSTLAAAALELLLIPLFGMISDRWGRKKMYMTGAVLMGIWAFPYFTLLNTGSDALVFVAILVSLVPHAMQYGPQAALIAESFPTNLRYGGAGIGYQLASVVAGGPASLVAAYLIHTFGTAYAISTYIAVSALITLVATAMLRDRSRVDIADDRSYSTAVVPDAAGGPVPAVEP
ncbi:MAG: MFS transporter [Actinocatenispora sp.]